ncbi:MAG: CHASE domain-containing protein [Verrucomicrobia bacterium]|nr:CHASE domain-containing protein [Verrucomicrobiota bacterium]
MHSVHDQLTPHRMTAPLNGKKRRLYIPWLVILLGFLTAAVSFQLLRESEKKRVHQEFVRRAQTIANLMKSDLHNQQDTLFTIRAIYHSSERVTLSEFLHASAELIERQPGLISLKWAPRIPADQRKKYEASAQADGLPQFEIHAASFLGSNGKSTELAQECFPIIYDTLADESPKTLGLDLTTSSAWADFQAAARLGTIRASGRVPHLGSETLGDAYLMELPVFRTDVPPTEAERLAQLRGFVLGVFKPSVVLENLLAQIPRTGLDILLVDRLSENENQPLHFHASRLNGDSTAVPSIETIAAGEHHRIEIPFAGREMEFWFRPAPDWTASLQTYNELMLAGFVLLVSVLLAIYLRRVFQQAFAVESLVAQRTAELTAIQRELREDIQRRSRIEQALKDSEQRYRTLVSQSSDAIWRLELSQPIAISLPLDEQVEKIMVTGRIAECNELTAQMYGYQQAKEIVGQHLSFLNPRSRSRHESLVRAFVQSNYSLSEHESSDTAPGGETRIFIQNLIGVVENEKLVRIWVTERELTHQRLVEQEKQAFERRLSETQRMESLGVLAGGIAHDFNNLLTGIMGHASLGRAEIPPDSPLVNNFEEIENASRSAANLCQQMLAYAGKGRFLIKPYDLSQIITQNAHLLHISVSKQAELRFNLANDLPPIMADVTQIQQIVMNLVINASEAIGARPGLITLTTGLIHPDVTTFSGCPYAPEKLAATYVFLEVRDNGCGISDEARSRIFEPFYTTKFSGRGLGLPAALGIVRSHAGALRVESRQGEGSTITLFLPAKETPAKEASTSSPTNSPWSAEGTLLIIDDEAPVRGVAERMAQSLGFSVLSAPDGQHGLDLYKLYRQSISVVLVDLSMPGLTGEETMEKLRALSSEVRIVVMSGYNEPVHLAVSVGRPPVFLSKPFTTSQFQAAVRQAIKHG